MCANHNTKGYSVTSDRAASPVLTVQLVEPEQSSQAILATLHIDGCDHRRSRVRFTSLDLAHDMRMDRGVWLKLGEPEVITLTIGVPDV